MNVLREYVRDVLIELRKDDEFIKNLKAIKTYATVPVTSIERMVDEWAGVQRGLRPDELRLAHRIAIDKFQELYKKVRGDEAAAKKLLHATLNKLVIRKAVK